MDSPGTGDSHGCLVNLAQTFDAAPHDILLAAAVAFASQWLGTGDVAIECGTASFSVACESGWSLVDLARAVALGTRKRLSYDDPLGLPASESGGHPFAVGFGRRDLPSHASTPHTAECAARFEVTVGGSGCVHTRWECTKVETAHRCRITLLASALETYLRSVLPNPTTPLGEVALVGDADLGTVLAAGRGRPAAWRDVPVAELIRESVQRWPDRVALECDGSSLTYAQLWSLSDAIAALLREIGVGTNQPVGVLMSRGPLLVPTLVAIWQAGGGYVPMDPTAPAGRLARTIDDLCRHGLRWILTDSEDAAARLGLDQGLQLSRDHPAVSLVACRVGDDSGPGGVDLAEPDRLAYVMYTSGSTGAPKGTVVTQANVSTFVQSVELALGGGDDEVTIATTPLTFDISVLELFWPLSMGRRVHLVKSLTEMAVGSLAAILRTPQPKLLQLTPSTAGLVDLPPAPNSLRVLVGGEALPQPTAAALRRRCDRLYNMYGPTESTVWVTYHEVAEVDGGGAAVSLGRPLPNANLLVLDARRRVVPLGMPGELYVYGPQVAAGYLGAPDLTADRFRADVLAGQVVYHTGDAVRFCADGTLEFLGRLDNQVKIAGHRVELGEVEAALREHPDIAEAAVVLARDTTPPQLQAFVRVSAEGRRVGDWVSVFDHEYGQPDSPSPDSPSGREGYAPDFRSWRSSLDGASLPEADMREWLDGVARLVLATGARRILDVGCGTGALLHALRPHIDRYVGVEPSAHAHHCLRRTFAQAGDMAAFVPATARDLAAPTTQARIRGAAGRGGSFDRPDCVVLSSVVQYFPSLGYLTDVLDAADDLLTPDGRLIIADVRSLPLLGRWREWLARGGGTGAAPSGELCCDPYFFLAWAARRAHPPTIWVAPKIMRCRNELSDFRFDVVVTKRSPEAREGFDEIVDYHSVGGRLQGLADYLHEVARSGQKSVAVTGIPNARLAADPATLGLVPLVPIEIYQRLSHLDGLRIGLDPAEQERGALLVAYRADGHHSWGAIAQTRPAPAILGTAPRLAVDESTMDDIWEFLAGRLPAHMVPTTIHILDRLPLTPSGKVDRGLLLRQPPGGREVRRDHGTSYGADAAPQRDAPERSDGHPRADATAELTAFLVGFMGDLLSTPVSPDDDLVQLGATSLQAAQLAGALWRRYRFSIAPGLILRRRTLRCVADSYNPLACPVVADSPVPANVVGARGTGLLGLSLAQRAMLVLSLLDPASSALTVVLRWRLEGPIRTDRLGAAVQRVTARHVMLRGAVSADGLDPRPGWSSAPALELLDAGGAPSPVPTFLDQLGRPFDLDAEPPARWALRPISKDTADLYAVLHHVGVDDAALATLHRELGAAYAGNPGEPSDVLTQRYAAALATERWLYRERVAADRDYWRGVRRSFAGCGRLTRSAPAPGAAPECRRHTVEIAGGRQLVQLGAQRAGITAFSFFLAAVASAVAGELGQAHLLVGVPVSSRELVGADGLLGCFANLIPVPVGVSGGDVLQLAAELQPTVLSGLDHGLLPFAEIARLAELPLGGDGRAEIGLLCQLEELPEPTCVNGVIFRPSLGPPRQALYPITVRGELTSRNLVLHVDRNPAVMGARPAARVAAAITTTLQHLCP